MKQVRANALKQKGFTPIFILVGILVVIGIAGGAYYFGKSQSAKPTGVVCTQEAKQCPDGSYVGRTGPKCEFSACPASTPQPSDETLTWKTYTSQEGQYSFKYSEDVKIYINEKFSVDGVKVPLKDTVVLLSKTLPELNTNYQISVNHKLTSASNLKEFVDQNSSCVYIESGKGKPYILGGKQALIFEDTPCGPYGMTSIYSLNNNLGYSIDIESHAEYNKINKYIDQILSTFKFTDQSTEGQFCGGIAGKLCSEGYSCQLDGNYPDAAGKCIKN